MPTIVETVYGRVSGLWGSAFIRAADGSMRKLELGDVVRKGDVILTAQDGIVELSDDTGTTRLATALAPSEADRVISSLEREDEDAAPGAGLAGGDGGTLGPGLRVGRISESTTPAGVLSEGPVQATDPFAGNTTAPELQLAVEPPPVLLNAAPTALDRAAEGDEDSLIPVVLGGQDADGRVVSVTVTGIPAGGSLFLADGVTPVTAGQTLTPDQAAGLLFRPAPDFAGQTGITFTVTDDRGAVSAPGEVRIGVIAVNDAPVAVDQEAGRGNEDSPITIRLEGTDVDGTVAGVRIDRLPGSGTLLRPDGVTPVAAGEVLTPEEARNLVFVPAPGFAGATDIGFSVIDDEGASSPSISALVTVLPVNDAPVADSSRITVIEDGGPVALGLDAPTDADGGPLTITVTTLPPVGTVTLADGTPLSLGAVLTPAELAGLVYRPPADVAPGTAPVSFGYSVSDGTATTRGGTTITLVPVDDPGRVTSGSAALREDAPPVSGQLAASDADNPGLAFVPANNAGAYGALVVDAAGNWTYTLAPAAQALTEGQVVTETFTVALNDGSSTTVTITVTGSDDAPLVTSGRGSLREDDPPISGRLNATDADNPALAFVPGTTTGAYGALVLDAAGAWTYTLAPAAQSLTAGQVVTETFDVRLNDGTLTSVTINVTGTDDAPVISAATGALREGDAPIGGSLTARDADNPALAFVPGTTGGAWGSLALAADGRWTYTLGPAAEALAGGQVVVERFNVALNDGSTTTVTVTVTGTDDAPVISAATGAITEDAPPVRGTLGAADADNPALAFVPGATTGSYGTLAVDAGGSWTYALGSAAQALTAGQVVNEVFTVTLNDGSTTTVTITVTGTDDAPVISAATGALNEGAPPIGGSLSAVDADNPGLAFVPATTAGAFGVLTLNAAGAWTYALGANAATLAAGQVVTELFTVSLNDGSTTTVTITVTGTDNTAVVTSGTGAITEDNPPIGGLLSATDIDNPALAFVPSTSTGSYGVLALDAAGAWTYTLAPAAQALAAGEVVTETFTVGLDDGTTTTVTITVTGTDDAPVISTASGAITEGAPPIAGTLSAADADNPALAFVPGSRSGAYGELLLDAAGSWTYTLAPAASALTAGQVVTEAFTVSLNDGSTTTVTITVTGTDDAPVITTATGAIVEGNPPIGGTLSATDPDNPGLAFVPASSAGAYGELLLDATGNWIYTLGPAAEALTAGQVVTETFTVALNDGSTSSVTITVTGTDDVPVISAASGALNEDSPPISGTLTALDADNPALAFVPGTTAGAWGSLALDASGGWTYTLAPAAQALAAGQVVTDQFTVRLSDGSTTTVTLTVTGSDDAAVVSSSTGALLEDGPPIGGRLTAVDADNPALAFVPGNSPGSWGTLGLDASGAWTYTLAPVAQSLAAGQVVVETFTVDLSDGSTTTVTITVTGTDDAPVISAATGAITEDQSPISGTLTATDVDNPALAFVPGTSAGAYGSLVLDAGGRWSYGLAPAAQALAAGQVVTEAFTVRLTDGSTTTVTITVTGTDDAPAISAATGALTEGAPPIAGTLTASDPDNPALAFVPATPAGAYGTLAVDAAGAWTYTLGPGAAALAAGQVVTEAFSVTLTDGSTTTVTITVTGTDDAPVVSAGTGAITEDTPPVSGTLTATDPDNPALAFVPGTSNGAYGALVLDAAGAWTYTLGPAAQALGAGQVVTETFTVTLTDGSTTTVTLTVTGVDDAPVISAATGAITEDAPPIAGTLTASDADNPALAFVPGATAGAYGTLALDAGGSWNYALSPAAQALAAGQVVTERFTVALTDGSTTTVTITVTGTDDAPVISAATGAINEGAPPISGTLAASDADNPGLAFVPATTAGAYGSLVLAADGGWTYSLGPAAAALAAGQVVTETFTARLNDGSTTTVTITVTGTDDTAVVSSGSGAVSEDGPPVSGQLSASDVDNPALAFVPATTPGAWGSLVVDAAGNWSYAPAPAAQALAGGQVVTETFTVALNDGTSTTVTITVTGTDDAPVISSATGAITEDAPPISGTLTARDADNPGLAFVPGNSAGAYGTLELDAGGAWRYTLGPAAQALAGGQVATETFTVSLNDGSTTTVTITVTGTDDAPVITSATGAITEDAPPIGGTLSARDADNPGLAFVPGALPGAYGTLAVDAAGGWTYALGAASQALAAGQVVTETFTVTLSDGSTTTVAITVTGTDDAPVISAATGAITEDAPPISGTLTATDADNPSLAFVPGTTGGAYGALALDAAGNWTYSLAPAAQALAAGQVVTETFTVALTDGSTTTVRITVTGVDDAPVVSAATGAITEDAPPIGGTLTAVDADNPALAFVPGSTAGAYGALVLDAGGAWTYTLAPAAQALAAGQVATESFTVTLSDGSTTTVTITVTGTDDAPVISSATGAITEDAPPIGGTLTATDADNPGLAFVADTTAGSYGTLAVDAAGQWSYALGAAAQALAAGQVVTERFTVALTDGSTTTVTVTVTGVDDAPVISAATGAITEDAPPIGGTLSARDADNPALAFVPGPTAGAYGTLSLDAGGSWTYALSPAAQALAAGQVVTERFSVALTDGSTTTVTISVTGTDDAPVISAATGALNEGAPPINGTLSARDADNPGLAFVPASTTGSYGALQLDAAGAWTYTLGAAAAALAEGQVVTDRFTVSLTDGSTTTVTITVTGTDSNAVVSSGSGAITEDAPPIGGRLSASDVDNPSLAFVPGTSGGAYGSLVVDAAGNWTYGLSPAAQALAAGQVVTERFTVSLNDGSTTTVTITVTGTDDAPVISTATGAITEDAPPISGTLTATDPDNPTLAFVPGPSAGAYGTLVLDAAGRWTYALSPAAQALAGGQVATETFTVRLNDGSTTTVTITVTGRDDAPVVSSATGAITEDRPPITGSLTASDADNPGLAFVPGTTAGSYGALALDASGNWTYSLSPAAQALAGGQVVTDRFTVALNDGSTTTVTVTVTGTDDRPVISAGTGAITEDAPPITGRLTASDADNPGLAFVPGTTPGAYGSLVLDAAGNWTYSLSPAAQALAGGQVVTERLTVTLNDGSTTTVTITVTGTNDAPVISTATGAITEDAPPISGTLTATDADNPSLAFVPGTSAGAYGSLALNAAGAWTYTLAPAAQSLAAGQVATERFTVSLNDGSTTTVTITVTGTNDLPVASGGRATGSEDTPVLLDWARFGIADVDSGATTLGVRFDAQPADGRVQVLVGSNWVDVTAGQNVSRATIEAGGLRFVPDANESGDASFGGAGTGNRQSTYTTIGFRPTDASGAGAPSTIGVTIAPVADAPTLSLGGQGTTGGTASISGAVPPSVGLLREFFDNVATVGTGNAVNTATVEANVEATTPTSRSVITDASVATVDVDDANRLSGFIFLEAGRSYAISGSRDDTLRIEIGGSVLFDQGYNTFGAFTGAAIRPTVSGYYSIEVIQYNGDGPGNLDLNLSVDGGPARDLSTANFRLYPDAGTITGGGGALGSFVANGDGGFYPAVLSGGEDSFIALGPLTLSRSDLDGSESLAIAARGLPAGATLSDGTRSATVPAGGGDIDLAGWDLNSLRVRAPADFAGELDFSIRATTTEPNGSTASSTLQLAVEVAPVNDAPVVGSSSGVVSEEGLASGNPDSAGSSDLTNATVATGTVTVSDVDSSSFGFSLFAPTTALTSGGVPVTWSGEGTGTLVASAGGNTIGTLTVDASGAWRFTLSGAIDHATGGAEDVRSLDFRVSASDGAAAGSGTISVRVEDDSPTAAAARSASVSVINTNLMIVLDVSGSMNAADGVGGLTRLRSAIASINELLDRYDGAGDVAVRIVTFSGGAQALGNNWTTVAQAKAQLAAISADGQTNYDAALTTAQLAFASSGRLSGAQNVSYFFSDGEPTRPSNSAGIDSGEEATWRNFLLNNQVRSYALGLGTGINTTAPLNPIAYDGLAAEEDDAVLVRDFDQLDRVLSGTVNAGSSGSLIARGSVDAVDPGADGGYLRSVTVAGVTYTYSPTTNAVTASSNASFTFDAATGELVVSGTGGSQVRFDMDSGAYEYNAPGTASAGFTERITYVASDRDGDTSTSTLDIQVGRTDVRTGTTSGETITGGSNADLIIGRDGDDRLNGGDGADRLYGNAGNDTLEGGDGADMLSGGAGNDTLRAGNGGDRLDGGAGNDALVGGSGADVFEWKLADRGAAGTPARDVVSDFDTARPSAGGDVLDLRDLLSGETQGTLQNYLDFDTGSTPGSTVIRISSTGGFTNGNYSSGAEDQRITLDSVDLRAAFGLAANASDAQVIQQLLDQSKLLTDNG